ncbi:hypothetical protein N2152v2_000322 [Parachlorella kessleri]
MRASRSVGKRAVQGLRAFANKAGKGNGSPGGKAGQATGGAAAPAPPKAGPAVSATPTPPVPAGAAAATSKPTTATPPPKPAAATPPPKLSTANPPPKLSAATPPPQSPAAAAAAQAAGEGNSRWIIHPAVPLDARVVALGVVGCGVLAYKLSTPGDSSSVEGQQSGGSKGGDEGTQAAASEFAEGEGGAVPAAQEAEQAQQEADTLADTAPQHVDEGFHAPAQRAEQSAQQAQQPQGEEQEPVRVIILGEEQEQQQVPPTFVDGSKVLSVIEEVLRMDTPTLLKQAHQAAEAPAPKEDRMQQTKEPAEQDKAGGSSSSSTTQPSHHHKGPVVNGDALAAIRSGLADTAGDLLASDVSKASPAPTEHEAAATHPPPSLAHLGPEVAHASSALAGVDPLVKEILGLEQDLTPAGLIQQAAQHGQGAGDDWLQYRHRHRQAVADAHFITALLEAAAKNVKGKLEEKESAIAEGQRKLETAYRRLDELHGQYRNHLAQALEDRDRKRQQALQAQSKQLAAAHAEALNKERVERQSKMDEVRLKLNALEQALQRRSSEQRTSHNAHQIASALESGAPLRGSREYLATACKGDALVEAALAAIPNVATEKGVWSRTQIAEAFSDVQRASRQLCWVPEGQGGFLTIALAKLAAKLKVSERGPLAAKLPGGGIDKSLAVVQSELTNGQLLKAAEDLEQAVRGTAAAAEVTAWVQHVRERVLAEQTAALLQAHASALTASLA